MKKIKPTLCKICGETRTERGFSFHLSQSHNMKMADYLVKYEFNGIHPTCMCGCGENVTIRSNQIMDYVDGHCPTGRFVKGQTPKRDRDVWLQRVTEGNRRFNKEAKIKNPDYRKGENNNFFNHRHTDKTKDLLRQKTTEQIKSGNHAFIGNLNGRLGKSNLEIKFENYLKSINVRYEHNFKVAYLNKDGHVRYKYYDFYIPILNMVVEIHGSYWHPRECTNQLTEIQQGNLENDIFKKKLSKERHYDILTIYDVELDDCIAHDIVNCLLEQYSKHKLDITISGYLQKRNKIELPDYWTALVDESTITVNLTPIGHAQNLYVSDIEQNTVWIGADSEDSIHCFYTVYAERKDIDKLVVEYGDR